MLNELEGNATTVKDKVYDELVPSQEDLERKAEGRS